MIAENTPKTEETKPKISGWAFVCLGIGVLGILVLFLTGLEIDTYRCDNSYRSFPATIILSCLAVAGYITAVIQFRGKRLATIGIWMAVVPCLIASIVVGWIGLFPKPGERTYQCRNNLSIITAANWTYADENALDGNKRTLQKNEWKILMEQGDLPPKIFLCPQQIRHSELPQQWQQRISEISCYVELQTFPVSATGAKVPVYACTQHVGDSGKGFFPIAWSDGSTTFFRGTLAEFQAQYLKK